MKYLKKFNESRDNIDYQEIFDRWEFIDQYWFARTKAGYIIECGPGFIDGEFILDTFENFYKYVENKSVLLRNINGYYGLDGVTIVKTPEGEHWDEIYLEEIYKLEHPDDDSFVLVPKKDIIDKWYFTKEELISMDKFGL